VAENEIYTFGGIDIQIRSASGYVDDGAGYAQFSFEGGVLQWGLIYPKKRYKNYEHFVGVLGKFNPYTFFLTEPISISGLTFEEIQKAYESKKEMFDRHWERLAAG
jgi:hypothetical protein